MNVPKGRYDVRIEKVKEDFKTVPENPTIANLMKLCLQERFLCDIGLLVTGSHAKVDFFSNFSCMFLNPNIFSNLNSNCSNLLDLRNLQEQVKKTF